MPEFICTEFTDFLPEGRLGLAEQLLLPRVAPVNHLLDGVAAPGAKGFSMDLKLTYCGLSKFDNMG